MGGHRMGKVKEGVHKAGTSMAKRMGEHSGEQLTGDDIDELLLSLIEVPSFPPGSPASSAETDEVPPSYDLTDLAELTQLPEEAEVALRLSKGACGSSCSDELPMAVDEETRRLRRMARNRRAAAVSRQRKKAHVESLQSQLDALRAENEQLRQCLRDAGLLSESDTHDQHGQPQPYVQQPEALWNRSLQLECTQLMPAVMIVMALALLLRSEFLRSVPSVQSVSTLPLRESAAGSACVPHLSCAYEANRLARLDRRPALTMLHCGT